MLRVTFLSTLFAALFSCAHGELVAVSPGGLTLASTIHVQNEIHLQDEDVLDHLREAIEEVQVEDEIGIVEDEFRAELFDYLQNNFRDVGNTTEEIDAALVKALATEMLGRRLGGAETVENIIGLMNRPSKIPDDNNGSDGPLARIAKKELIRRIVKGEAAHPKYGPGLALQTDLMYQVIEKSKEPFLSELNDWECYCGGDCCMCPWTNADEQMRKSKEASDPKRLQFACICSCCPCNGGGQDPDVPPPSQFPPKIPLPMGLLCGLLKMGACPW
ncbi:hypothetical protein F4821DRAFT_262427 [Hypoxylon rubiginosum]|uniref:Uncharacterized protein n=1 Tax=Hypoxylon rubiginosum TaxID=110542 RepID=A0ACC0CU94_9PEZI|nr:hypothetical protein F4821DRAFT_262427 [Hypoxylon rubiginosum]